MPQRTFLVTVSESPARVVVEDVRGRRRTVAADLSEVGGQIRSWLASPAASPPAPSADGDDRADPAE